MSPSAKVVCLAVLVAALAAHDAHAGPKTVCTITVNSPDEKEVFRRNLPQDEYRFVELVERGRPDWLASACRAGVRCDVLVISGHFDGGTEFYTDRLDQREFLPVDEMERVSCSDSCPGLFSHLKEVYLFGCKTLNAEAQRSASAEIARSLVRSGYSTDDAERVSRVLNERHGESNRDRMRHIFKDVPVIYGFSSKAPLGPIAASTLNRYFQSDGNPDLGSGRTNPRFLGLFAPTSMTVATGATDADLNAGFRRDVCHFSDDRLSAAQKLRFVHDLLRREMAEVRMFLDHIEKYSMTLSDLDRRTPEVSRELAEIANDRWARKRFLEFARDADQPAIRARMVAVARTLGWLTPDEQRAEYLRMIGDQLRGTAVGAADVDLVCSLNRHHELGLDELGRPLAPGSAGGVARAAILACLGSGDARLQVLRALTSSHDDDVQIAQVYLRHRPIADASELRVVTSKIVRMTGADAQTRALETLTRYQLSDRESLRELAELFPRTKSVGVQRAIAGILIRSDYQAIASPALLTALRHTRLKSPDGKDVIDVLIRRMETAL